MADAKIRIQTIADNKELQGLNDALADGTVKLKKMQKELRELERSGKAEEGQVKSLTAAINKQKLINAQYSVSVKHMAAELANGTKSAGGFKDALSGLSSKLGIDLGNLSLSLTAIAGAAAAVGGALIASGREASGMINQFRNLAGSAEEAERYYNLFNETYRNTNYDEQKVYNMAKGLLAIGLSAEQANECIIKAADASAELGKGVEFTEMLVDAFKRLHTGGELTEKQYKALAEAGVDLTDVQDKIRASGEEGFNALREKLAEYEGGMGRAKQTAGEMEGDIKGNLVEIGRQTALLVDEIFGFSDMLRSFYQWIIEVSAEVISSIKSMVAAVRSAKAESDAYGRAMQEWEDIYGKDFQGSDAERARVQAAYADATAAVVAESEKRKREAIAETIAMEKKQIQTIARRTGTGGGGGGGTSRASTPAAAAVDPAKALADEIAKANTLHSLKMANIAAEREANLISEEEKARLQQIELESYVAFLQAKRDAYAVDSAERLKIDTDLYNAQAALAAKPTEAVKQQTTGVQQYYQQMAQSFSAAMTNCIMNAEDFGEAFKDVIKGIIAQLMQAAIYAAIVSAFTGGATSFGSAFKSSLGIGGKADGGYISGPGSATSDTAGLYALSNGEYVLNAAAVEAVGRANLDRINGAGRLASGGAVAGGAVGGNVTLNVSAMDASGFGDFLARGGLDSIKQALYDDDRMFGQTAGVF